MRKAMLIQQDDCCRVLEKDTPKETIRCQPSARRCVCGTVTVWVPSRGLSLSISRLYVPCGGATLLSLLCSLILK